ncbi:MAG TPA: response regulator [Candidatus Methylacidiphilales bacterium]
MSRIYSTIDPDLGVAPSHGGAGTRLLVVEDNPDDQELLRRQLRKAAIHEQILFVRDGGKAIDILIKDELHIRENLFAVFLDLHLKGLSGIDVLRAIRSEPALVKLPVVILTSSQDPKDITECRRLRATTYLTKPISFQVFYGAIANLFHLPDRPHRPDAIDPFLIGPDPFPEE